jgi:predicted RNA binding protein YcfA (HicA-like mRNA interferase family)
MTNREAERLLKEAGYWLLRNGAKHAIYTNGTHRHTIAHGKLSHGAFKHLLRILSHGREGHGRK